MLGGHGRGPKDQSRWWFHSYFLFSPLFGQPLLFAQPHLSKVAGFNMLSGWWFQIVFYFHPLFGEDIQIDE